MPQNSLTYLGSSSNVRGDTLIMSSKTILAYGEDALVISTRAMILHRAGYEVAHYPRS